MRDGRMSYVGPDDGAPDASGAELVDASGATIIPGLVDCHAHFTGLGGANWIARFGDPEADLLARGAEAARDLARMGILTARCSCAPDSNRTRRWHRRRGSAASFSASKMRGRSVRVARRTSFSFMGTRCPIRRGSGACGAFITAASASASEA